MLARLLWVALLSQRDQTEVLQCIPHRTAVITDAVRFSIVCARTILFGNYSFHHHRLAIHYHYRD